MLDFLFVVPKILGLILQPLSLIFITQLIALLLVRWHFIKAYFILTSVSLCVIFVISYSPLMPYLMHKYENQYERPNLENKQVDGIIALGAGINATLSHEYKTLSFNPNVARIVDFVELIKKYPNAIKIFTGGSGGIETQQHSEAPYAKEFIQRFGIDTNQILFESTSRNTHENATNSLELLQKLQQQPQENQTWLLVTSAKHMPRAMAIFNKANWKMTAYPTNFSASKKTYWINDPQHNWHLAKALSYEIIAICFYYITNRI